MNALKKYTLIALLLCFVGLTQAQTNGCYVAANLRMYYQTPVAANPTTYFEGSAYYRNQSNCGTESQYYTIASGPTGTNCWAHYKGSGSKTNGSRYNVQGKKATFNLLLCPIDDYIIPFMLVLGGTGFLFIRRSILT